MADFRRLQSERAEVGAERVRPRQSLRVTEAVAAHRLTTRQATVRAFTCFEAPERAVAHDPALVPGLQAALDAGPARPGWTAAVAELVLGEPVVVHRQAGRGRTGGVLAAHLVHQGLSSEAAAAIASRLSTVPAANLVAAGRRFAAARGADSV